MWVKQSNFKTVFMVVGLIAALGVTAAFAKEGRGHLVHPSAGAVSPKSDAGKAAVKPAGSNQQETVPTPEVGSAPPSGLVRDKSRDLRRRVEIAPAATSQAHRVTPGESVVPRNALGAAIRPPVTAGGSVKADGGRDNPAAQKQRPIVNASIGSQNKLGGVGVIRPALVPSGLGGPAKTVSGINGTTVRSKH